MQEQLALRKRSDESLGDNFPQGPLIQLGFEPAALPNAFIHIRLKIAATKDIAEQLKP